MRWTHFFLYFVSSIYVLVGGRRSAAESHVIIKLFPSVPIWQLPQFALQLFHQTIVAGGKAISVALWDSAVDLMAIISRPVTTGWTSLTADRAMVTERTQPRLARAAAALLTNLSWSSTDHNCNFKVNIFVEWIQPFYTPESGLLPCMEKVGFDLDMSDVSLVWTDRVDFPWCLFVVKNTEILCGSTN